MFADDSSTITSKPSEVAIARENIHMYEKVSTSKLHDGKTIIIKLGKARTKNVTKALMKVNFTIMKENDNETYLGDIIGNNVTEEQTFDKAIKGMEKLGEKWLKEIVGIHGRTIVANTLLTSKIAHRASVNGISKNMKNNINKTIKELYGVERTREHE